MLLLALLWTLLGLWNLLLPRKYFFVGSRWQLKDGDRAEPSDAYVLAVRAGGVLFLMAAASFTIWHFSLQAQAETRESLESAWEVTAYNDDAVRVIENPDVVTVPNVALSIQALDGERMGLPTWKTAVIGQDEVGNLGVSLHDGDLWMAAVAGSCTPAVLMVHESATSVTIAMTADSNPVGQFGYLPCFGSGYQRTKLEQLVIVRVPLDEPLGGREVITVPAPERELNFPFPPFQPPANPPETSTSTPTPSPTPTP